MDVDNVEFVLAPFRVLVLTKDFQCPKAFELASVIGGQFVCFALVPWCKDIVTYFWHCAEVAEGSEERFKASVPKSLISLIKAPYIMKLIELIIINNENTKVKTL